MLEKKIKESLVDKKYSLVPFTYQVKADEVFVKGKIRIGNTFQYIKNKFPKVGEAIEEAIFVGPEIRQLMNDKYFYVALLLKEKVAWHCFKSVLIGFLGNNKPENFNNVDKVFTAYHKEGCNQDLSKLKEQYQRRWDANMLGYYGWLLIIEELAHHYTKENCQIECFFQFYVCFIMLTACNFFSILFLYKIHF